MFAWSAHWNGMCHQEIKNQVIYYSVQVNQDTGTGFGIPESNKILFLLEYDCKYVLIQYIVLYNVKF